jgi:hypothetical protein
MSTGDLNSFAEILRISTDDYHIKSAIMATSKSDGTSVVVIECDSASDASKLFREARKIIDLLYDAYDGYTFKSDQQGRFVFFGESQAVKDARDAYKSTNSPGFLFWFILCLVVACSCGYITQKITSDRGYYGGFAWGFFLGVIGIIIVYKNTPRYSPSQTSKETASSANTIIIKESAPPTMPSLSDWTCSCGRTNAHYVSSCTCGLSKRQNTSPTTEKTSQAEKAQTQKQPTKTVEENVSTAKKESDIISDIKQYKELLDSGIITQEEFDAKKKQLLGL